MSVKGTISENELMMKLVQAKKVLNKVEGGNYEKTNISEKFLEYNTEDFEEEIPQKRDALSSSKRIMESKLKKRKNVFMWNKIVRDFKIREKVKDLNDLFIYCWKTKNEAIKNLDKYFTNDPLDIRSV
jgi:hypothetical protein